ncbi:hypothetical protein H7691_12405 [Stenotrophomonas sp. CW117]|uniref:hypothetical protein n=1 Tax=Stenotrophomonas TaxID=40323 RepID=UPI00070349EF|nr:MULTISPECIES: hypothetical protein [Stenotrophomonas]KRG80741.1 hypothetical protein ABB33_17500 [Stenotrophomonas acidaminiphila]QOF97439.1 hypothetical protein H7691_12405 [Stenotrophomonas sp. CW117]
MSLLIAALTGWDKVLIISAAVALLAGCSSDAGTYTLYRNSALSDSMRVHVATFNSKEGDNYNRENCDLAAQLFAAQPGIGTRFWCEKGAFRE